MNIFSRFFISSLLIFQCAFLWNSDFVLHSNLTENESNDIIFVLLSKGIKAKKVSSKDGFSVLISNNMVAKAMKVLRGHGLPHGEFTDLGKTFASDGLVSSPSQENIKYIHAISEEIEEAISNIDGVMVVRVNLVVAKQNSFGDEISPASAAIFIKYHPDYDMTFNVPKIKQLVSNSVANLDYTKVTVALFEAVDFDLSEVPEEDDDSSLLIILALAALFISAVLFWFYYSKKQDSSKGSFDPSLIIDKKKKKGDIFELIESNENKEGSLQEGDQSEEKDENYVENNDFQSNIESEPK